MFSTVELWLLDIIYMVQPITNETELYFRRERLTQTETAAAATEERERENALPSP